MTDLYVYPQVIAAFSAGELNWTSEGGLKMALMGTGFGGFNDTHDSWADVSASEYAGATGYTAGGQALANKALTEVDSSSLTARANTTAYSIGDVVRTGTDSARVFLCVVGGTSAGSEPGGMATLGLYREIADGSVTWVNIGSAITVYDSDPVEWTGLDSTGTIGAIIYNDDGVNEPLVCFIDFQGTETPTEITVTPPGGSLGWVCGVAGGTL